jgi:hypothetical protein
MASDIMHHSKKTFRLIRIVLSPLDPVLDLPQHLNPSDSPPTNIASREMQYGSEAIGPIDPTPLFHPHSATSLQSLTVAWSSTPPRLDPFDRRSCQRPFFRSPSLGSSGNFVGHCFDFSYQATQYSFSCSLLQFSNACFRVRVPLSTSNSTSTRRTGSLCS